MRLSELLDGLEIRNRTGDLDVEIGSIAYDSRKAIRGTLFVCIEGFVTDGHRYVQQAASQGATVFLVQKPVEVPPGATVVEIADTRKGLAHVSDRFFGHPSGRLRMIGITGTKGKTTTSYMVRAILRAAGRKTGLIGTIANIIGDEVVYASRTTPESYDLQALLSDMVSAGMDSCVMEVSSQGLALDRVYRTEYGTGVFTNLYNDHIGPSEHADFEEYLVAKTLLFERCRNALINGDAPHADRFRAASTGRVYTYGMSEGADVRATRIEKAVENDRVGTRFHLDSPWFSGTVFVGMPGRFNLYNALAAIGCAGLAGVGLEHVREGLADATVKGRVQPIPTGRGYTVVVDYAHNAASLESLLETLREYVDGRLMVVFGCGGDRAKSRRYEMGEVAGRLADFTYVTSDNPRTEDPVAILADILSTLVPTGGAHVVVPDRREAIFRAIADARPGDMVVIAGKGHENYQIFADRTLHFDDAETAQEALDAVDAHDATNVPDRQDDSDRKRSPG
jgi:UDP-N-acetylmuramoyl-L-alanyl-D-glutamate--2,6-diaminopimelate ligase